MYAVTLRLREWNSSTRDISGPLRADGSGKTQLTSGALYGSLPTFSPDGHLILFTGLASGNAELWVMNADGTFPHPITNTTGTQSYRAR